MYILYVTHTLKQNVYFQFCSSHSTVYRYHLSTLWSELNVINFYTQQTVFHFLLSPSSYFYFDSIVNYEFKNSILSFIEIFRTAI